MKFNVSGPPPDAELPQKPFGLVDISQQEKNVSLLVLEELKDKGSEQKNLLKRYSSLIGLTKVSLKP